MRAIDKLGARAFALQRARASAMQKQATRHDDAHICGSISLRIFFSARKLERRVQNADCRRVDANERPSERAAAKPTARRSRTLDPHRQQFLRAYKIAHKAAREYKRQVRETRARARYRTNQRRQHNFRPPNNDDDRAGDTFVSMRALV